MRILLTFDVEDFVNPRSMWSLSYILSLLERYRLKGLFFITGHMAEKIKEYPEIIEGLEHQIIGYHSSSHTIRPGILEYCDVESYEEAVEISLRRETSHIDPLTGMEQGIGGLRVLSEVFPEKRIISFRAPCCAWAPPHLEALRKLGIDFDFSTYISSVPFKHGGMTFFPSPLWATYQVWSYYGMIRYGMDVYLNLLRRVLKNKIVVLAGHPCQFVNAVWWDSIYRNQRFGRIRCVEELPIRTTERSLYMFGLLLRGLARLHRKGLIRIMSSFQESNGKLSLDRRRVSTLYSENLERYLRGYGIDGWKPRYLFSHFERFLLGRLNNHNTRDQLMFTR